MRLLVLTVTTLFFLSANAQKEKASAKAYIASFNAAENQYIKLQEDLKALQMQEQQALTLLKAITEKQKQLASETKKIETAYNSFDTAENSQGQLLNATKQMQETQMSFNLQYLQLQNQMQNENRSYTMVSNIMKTKHDTVKNSISNIR